MSSLVPPEATQILLVLFLSFLLGLEREGRKATAGHYIFGGVRTFPLIGLLGFALAHVADGSAVAVAAGFAVVGAFLLVSYLHKLQTSEDAGVTTEITGLLTYALGVLVHAGALWIAATLVVVAMLLLELKVFLEGLTERISSEEIITFTKFLLLTIVILPVVPNRPFTSFAINPFRTWLVVVAVSGVSYASYLLQRATRSRGGIPLAAVLGGAYSSTVMTVVLARRAARELRPNLFAGSILLASGVMYVRLAVLVAAFNGALARTLAPPFLALAALALVAGFVWIRRGDAGSPVQREYQAKNPLELRSAFLFAAIFVGALVATHLTLRFLGTTGVYALAVLMGVTDVDPFILGLAQSGGAATPLAVAAGGIVVAAAANNIAKGVYAYSFADRATGRRALVALLALAVAGLVPLLLLG